MFTAAATTESHGILAMRGAGKSNLAAALAEEMFGAGLPFLAALGDFDPLPKGEGLQQYWLQRLSEGERRLLEHLIAAYPAGLRRDELDRLTDYKRSSRDAYLQRLSARKLVIFPSAGFVEASEAFFG